LLGNQQRGGFRREEMAKASPRQIVRRKHRLLDRDECIEIVQLAAAEFYRERRPRALH
jgi:hypothetical protein